MTTTLWITNVIVALLVIADMLYGRHMSKKILCKSYTSVQTEEEVQMDYSELELRDAVLEIRIEALEIELRKLKKKPKTKATKKKNASKS